MSIVDILVAIAPDAEIESGLLLGQPGAFIYMGVLIFFGWPVALFMLSYFVWLIIGPVLETAETNGKWEALGYVSFLAGFVSLMVAVCLFSWIALVVAVLLIAGAICCPKNPNCKDIHI